ncbi:tripartite tricarboxylate transporter substrate binding protein [Pseudacidovorax intermedius]|uniref:Bug family tripartite tricarboxylate transporter substrate binding protein n=1 Tax=Pseudacidovorax intermedius TaxID=433924 RepID=UPI0026F0E117|nr:tripartite tricarboxylate transporter substrate binding protein [Pseudacidovorax intermedius]
MNTRRRTFVASGLAGALAAAAPFAQAQSGDYPNRPIRLVVPTSSGSTIDVIAREYAKELQQTLGQPIVVDNKPGANMSIGVGNVIASPADGYTLLLTTTEMVRAPMIYSNISYDPFKQFVPLAHIASTSIFFVVPANSPATTLTEFVALSRSTPQPLSYGTTGQGSGSHFYGELIAVQTGARMNHIPYKGEVPMLPDLLAGRLDAGFISGAPALQYSRSGRIRILAGASLKQRATALPQVPTLAEQGVRGTDIEGFIGYFVARGTPTPIVQKLARELNRIAALPAMKQRVEEMGFESRSGSTVESFQTTMKGVHDGWAEVNRMVTIKLD